MAVIVVDSVFEAPLSDAEHDACARRLDPCLEAHGARWMRSYLAQDRTRMICEFESADAEAVRASYRSAEMPFRAVWVAELYAR